MTPPILQLTSSTGLYGAEKVLLELALHLREAGWPVHIGGFVHGDAGREVLEAAENEGLATVALPCRGALDPGAARALREYVATHGIRIVHSHKYKTDLYAAWAGLPRGVARVATCHNWISDSPKLRIYEWLDKRVLRGFDHVVAVSGQVYAKLWRAGVRRASLIRNGLRIQPAHESAGRAVRAQLDLPHNARVLLLVGRLSAEKALDVLLDALARLPGSEPPIHALLAGDGPLRAELEARARDLGLADRVHFLGFRRDVPALLAAAEAYVISSHTEGLPMVLLEAMAAGVPVVSTAVGEIPRVLGAPEAEMPDGRTRAGAGGPAADAPIATPAGLLVSPGDVAALATAMHTTFSNPDAAVARAAEARAIYETFHSREAMGQRYEQVYRSLA